MCLMCGSSSFGVVSVDEEAIRAASMKRAVCQRSRQDFRRMEKSIAKACSVVIFLLV